MNEYKFVPLGENVEEMFIGPFGSSLKNECFVDEDEAYCMVYEQKHAIQKTMDVETRYVNEQKYNELKRFNIHGGDIIVSCRGTIGETFVVPEDAPLGIMHPSIMKIRLKDGVYDKYYFNLLLKSRLKKHEAEANGSGIKMAISATELGRELFPVPTMQEQQEITDIISGISDVIEKRKQELSALDDLIKARFVEMFGDPVTNPKGLPIVTLGELSELITKGASPSWQGFSYTDDSSQTIFVTSENVREGYIDLSLPKYIEDGFNEKQKRSVIHKGDFLINIVGASIGRAAQFNLDCKANMNQAAALVRVKDSRVRDKYLLTYLNSDRAQRMYDSMKSDTGRANLSLQDISDLLILLPNVEQQIEFETFVNQVDKSKVAVQKTLEQTQTLFDSLMQKYFG